MVSGSADAIYMVEGGSLEISEAEMLEALKVAQKGIKDLIALERKVIDGAPRRKMAWERAAPDAALVARVRELAEKAMASAINAKDKAGRASSVKELRHERPDAARDRVPGQAEGHRGGAGRDRVSR